ncbi:DUF6493 family protein [Streptomyces sp. MS1.HAVA.3]|uniref:DUF6493 family protein n=1 Tax=Streptomyces caledonius TaxID=3134107 RepID=A0ABU8UGK4_9ACTN
MNTLLDAVRIGRCDLVTGLLAPLTTTERRARLPELTALRREIRGWGWSRRWDEEPTVRALHLAGALCHTGAAAAASWIAARDLRDGRSRDTAPLAALLADRDPAWRADVAHRLAARTATVQDDYSLIRALLEGTGAPPPPPTDSSTPGPGKPPPAPPAPPAGGARAAPTPCGSPCARTPTYRNSCRCCSRRPSPPLPRLVRRPQGARPLARGTGAPGRRGRPGAPRPPRRQRRPAAARRPPGPPRLLRRPAGRPRPHRGRTGGAHRGLDRPGRRRAVAHGRPRAADPHRALRGGPAPRRPPRRDVRRRALPPEKKLVRAQLVLLGKALRRDPDDRFALLPATAAAFGHADTALQERALKLVAAHLRPEDDDLRTGLAFEAEQLGPALRRTAAGLLGALADPATDPAGYEETLPAAPARRRLAADGAPSVAETVELVAALVKSSAPTAAETETALDLLVRHTHRDRAALAAALLPALADRHWARADAGRADPDHLGGPELLAAAVLGRLNAADLAPDRPVHVTGFGQNCIHAALHRVTTARAREAALRVLTAPLPFLLATPTWDCGTLEPQDLVTRLAAYGRQGAAPAPVDFAQALLRVRRDPQAAAAAGALGTPEGRRLAAWLTADGEPAPHTRRVTDRERAPRNWWGREREGARRIVLELSEHPVLQREFPAVFHRLGRPCTGTSCCWHWRGWEPAHLAVLPQDRETQAVWLLPDVTGCATDQERGAGETLSRLAELGGPAGPALHLAVATALGARHAEDRLAAVDALLVLAARAELDTALLGRDLAELLALGTVKPNRLADAARTAAATGAYATTWAVLAGALPAVLADGPARARASSWPWPPTAWSTAGPPGHCPRAWPRPPPARAAPSRPRRHGGCERPWKRPSHRPRAGCRRARGPCHTAVTVDGQPHEVPQPVF